MMTALSLPVEEDASTLIIFVGKPLRLVAWTLDGPGTLTPLNEVTSDTGVACATYEPGSGTAGETAEISVLVAEDA